MNYLKLIPFMLIMMVLASCSNAPPADLETAAVRLEPAQENLFGPTAQFIYDAEAAGNKAAALYSSKNNGDDGDGVRFTLAVSANTYKVSVLARGDQYEGSPVLRLSVDGQQVGADNAVRTTFYKEQRFGEVSLQQGQVLEVVFVNDLSAGSGKDRNVYIDSLTLTPTGTPAPPAPDPEPDPNPDPNPEPPPGPRPPSGAQWQSLNPGAGGQIQDVVLNPSSANRAFVLSDVEGLYRTENGGQSWLYSSQGLAGTNTLALAYDPNNPSRVYLGTTVGLHTSDDGGRSWRLQNDTSRKANPGLLTKPGRELAVGSVVVDPNNPQQVLAGVGNKRDSDIGQATVFRSTNGGQNFTPVRFGPNSSSDKSILQLDYAANQRTAYAATAAGGLWRGSNFGQDWSKLPTPSGASERVEGVAVSPDGGTLYAAFGRPGAGGTQLYATRTQTIQWRTLQNAPSGNNLDFRNLVIDPRSGPNAQKLLTATGSDRTGLYEVTVSWSGDTPQASWQRVFYYGQRSTAPFETGWEGGFYGNKPRPLAYRYTPPSWGGRGVWTTGDQTLFKVDDTSGNWTDKWQQIYTSSPQGSFSNVEFNLAFFNNQIVKADTIRTYSSVGWQSTVDMDVSGYGDVVMRSGADHAVILSYDGGKSWEDVSSPRRAKSQANAIVKVGNDVYLLAHFSGPFDFGAANTEAELWGAKIDPNNPRPVRWTFLAGGSGKYGSPLGLANNVYTNIVADPKNPGRIYVSSREQGIYVISDIASLYRARTQGSSAGSFSRLSGSPSANEYEGSLVLDPNDSSVLYAADGNTLYRGRLQDQRWNWTPILQGSTSSGNLSFDAWDRGGTTQLAAVTGAGDASEVRLSNNGGSDWTQLLGVGDLKSKRNPLFDFSDESPVIFGIEGRGDALYLSVQTFAPTNLGYGVFKVNLSGNNPSGIRDITGNLPFPKSFRTKLQTDPVTNKTYLYMASWGAGTWRLQVD